MFWENIKEAFSNILVNKMRSILTMLGIIIGISAVIMITTIGSSIRSTLSSTLNSLGGSSLNVYLSPQYPETEEEWENWEYPEIKDEDMMKDYMFDELVAMYPDEFVGIAAAQYLTSGKIQESAEKYATVSVQGMSPTYLKYSKVDVIYGRNITDEDNKNEKNCCIIADTMAKFYFPDEDPVGKMITVDGNDGKSYDLVVIGIYERKDSVFGKENTKVPEKDRETYIFIPYKTVNKISGEKMTGYSDVNILVKTTADSKVAQSHLEEFMSQYYGEGSTFHIEVYNMASELKIIDTVINVITVAISLIAAISLIVGGVGVMNIMLVSITERTREIGVRMALGAKRKVIRSQFVIEAIVLCIIGGIIGILIGVAFGYLMGAVASMIINSMYSEYAELIVLKVTPSGTAIFFSLFFSMLTGVFFGYYPANKAAKMEVIDALRYE